jgi:hypothetical protein
MVRSEDKPGRGRADAADERYKYEVDTQSKVVQAKREGGYTGNSP